MKPNEIRRDSQHIININHKSQDEYAVLLLYLYLILGRDASQKGIERCGINLGARLMFSLV